MKNILITGCGGYIGSIFTQKALKNGLKIFGFDNFSTGHYKTIEKLKSYGDFTFYEGDLKNQKDLQDIFKNKIDAVIHFAGLSQVAQSQEYPSVYYKNNVLGSINLFKAMVENNVKKIVFSSTAAIYGVPKEIPIKEIHPANPINVYGQTKLIIEKILTSLDSTNNLKSAKLRYFNACGASNDCVFGEIHNPETHLIPNILKMKDLKIFGNNYPTKDGTCVRDYIDVEDIAQAHFLALEYLDNNNSSIECNLGSKNGYSVKEIINMCEKITNKKIEYKIYPPREGDSAILIADNSKAEEILGWKPKIDIKESIKKAYKYQNS